MTLKKNCVFLVATLQIVLIQNFFCRFWGMLGYLANTLIFILVGVVIAQQAFSDVETIDWIYVIALYIGVMVIR